MHNHLSPVAPAEFERDLIWECTRTLVPAVRPLNSAASDLVAHPKLTCDQIQLA
jgi:hypothetical protein